MKIRTRITLFVTTAGLLVSFVFSAVLVYELLEQPFRILDTLLNEEADRTVAALTAVGRDDFERLMESNAVAPDTFWISVLDAASGEIIFRSKLAREVELRELPPGKKAIVPAASPGRDKVIFRVRSYEVTQDGGKYFVQIARSMKKLYEEIWLIVLIEIIGLVLTAAALAVAGKIAARKIVEPINEIKELAKKISDRNLTERLPVAEHRDELAGLADTLNGMLDRLQNSFERQKELLYDTSHELKTPLTTMRLAIESLRQCGTGNIGASSRNLDRLENQVRRMDRLVKELLQLSAMEARKDVKIAPVDVGECLASIAGDYKMMTDELGIEMTLRLPEGIFIEGDRDRLRRAFSNILDNAVKYNRANGWIKVEAAEASGSVGITVENSGEGVLAGEAGKVFDQFYRGEKARTFTADGGFGLGLAIVKKTAVLHNGSVTFESGNGKNKLSMFFPAVAGEKRRRGHK